MFEKILVCLDGSEIAERILPYAEEQALHFQSTVTLLHVVPEPMTVTPGIPGAAGVPVETPGMLEQMKKEQQGSEQYLGGLAERMRQKGINADIELLQGRASDAIVSYAHDNDFGLVAMVSHGHSGIGQAILGSVAESVLRNSGKPVLMVKARGKGTSH